MPAKQQDDPGDVIEKQERQQLSAKIGNQLMRTLGQPSDLYCVQIRPLWKDHYRVNVLVGVDFVSARMAHSYFVIADGDGNIVLSTPKITRAYRPLMPVGSVLEGDVPPHPL